MKYFLFYCEEHCIGKAKTTFDPLVQRWLSDPNAKECTQEVYDNIKIKTLS